MSTKVFHLRVKQARVKGRPGYSAAHFRRVSGIEEHIDTVCGAEPTDHDVTRIKDLVEWSKDWIPCEYCRS